jgi:hypothetical protein
LILNQLEVQNFTIQNWFEASIIIRESDVIKNNPTS